MLFAVSKLGAVIVPMNWRLAAPELAAVLADSRAPVLIAGEQFSDLAAELADGCDAELIVVGDRHAGGYEQWLSSNEALDPGHRGDSGDVVVQMYTSGTTGVPKGVLTTHRNNLAAAAETSPRWQFDPASVSLTPLPMFHIGGIGWAFVGLWNGATTILVRDFDPAAVLDTLERAHVTNAVFVPTMLQMLCDVPDASRRDFSALRSIAYGASPITTSVLKAALRTFQCSLFGIYGLTETTGAITQLDPGDHEPEGPREHLLRSAGRPYPWAELRIADPATGATLPPGEVGEIWLRAPNVTPGYFNRPTERQPGLAGHRPGCGPATAATSTRRLPAPDGSTKGMTFPATTTLPAKSKRCCPQHSDVREVAVIGVPDERWGETVKALIVRRPGSC